MKHLALAIILTFPLTQSQMYGQNSRLPYKSELITFKGQLLRQPPNLERPEPIEDAVLLFYGPDSLLFKLKTEADGMFEVVIDPIYQHRLEQLRIKALFKGIEWEIQETYPHMGKLLIIPTYTQPEQRLQAVKRFGHLWSGTIYKADEIRRW